MPAIEFRATIKDGAIEIPAEHLSKLSGGVTVIVVPDERPVAAPNLIDRLLAAPLHVTGFKPLTRAEIYRR